MKKYFLFILLIFSISCEHKLVHDLPFVLTGEVTNINATSATFTGKITKRGNSDIIESGFVWGVHPNNQYGIRVTNELTPENTYSLVTNEKLLPSRTYYVRAYVETETTMTYGNEVSFESLDGEINLGSWSNTFSTVKQFQTLIKSSFSIDNNTYFVFGDGSVYVFNHTNNDINYLLNEPLLSEATISLVNNNKAYIICGDTFHKFDPNQLTFTRLSSHPEGNLFANAGFIIDDNIYIGLGRIKQFVNDFWKYNITTDSWHQVASFPGIYPRLRSFSFVFNGIGYVGGGYRKFYDWGDLYFDFWSYHPDEDVWRQKGGLPEEGLQSHYLPLGTCYLGIQNKSFGYIYNSYNKRFFEYYPAFDTWEEMNPSPSLSGHMFVYNENVFFVSITLGDRYVNHVKMYVYEK